MPWNSLSLTELPTVLAGPILRKVSNNEVSVWLALKSGESITLDIYENITNQVVQSKTDAPIKLGNHFYVICIRAWSSTSFLLDGTLYGYNITNSAGQGFSTPGFLHGGKESITFVNDPTFGSLGNLPTFSLPSSNLEHLRIIHGSCRKPHGDGIDAFAAIHDSYETATLTLNSIHDRPQMLCLTGDQIYADDVADQLLYMIRSYMSTLFNWEEVLPTNPSPSSLRPGYRAELVLDIMNFPNDKWNCKSHLLKFQEFMLMYAMAWSPALWGNSASLPEFNQVFNGEPEVFTLEQTNEFAPISDYMPLTPSVSLTKRADTFKKDNDNLKSFRNTLPKATKALANIPTYMIFDDHEISDDWFINYKWTKNALIDESLQRRVVQNGMAAYSICQGWGNTPEQFENGQPGRTLVNYFETIALSNNNSSYSNLWQSLIGKIVLPDADVENGNMILRRPAGGLKYHWVYVGNEFEVIALDCRSRRAFETSSPPDDKGIAFIISTEGITEQVKSITSPKKKITFLISGTPVYGSGTIEASIEAVSLFKPTAEIDLESWNINEKCRHTLLSALCSRATHWSSDGWLIQTVIVLSGDVHYGFTNYLEYVASNTYQYGYHDHALRLIQCCASSMKNQTSPAGYVEKYTMQTTTSWHRHDSNSKLALPLNNFKHFGYNNESGNQVVEVNLSFSITGTKVDVKSIKTKPTIIKTSDYLKDIIDNAIDATLYQEYDFIEATSPPDWTVKQIALRAEDAPLNHDWTTLATAGDYYGMSSNHAMNFLRGNDAGRFIVGYNQFGDIQIRLDEITADLSAIDHRIWWRNFGANGEPLATAFPLSTFLIFF